MTLDANKFATACALGCALFWLTFSLLFIALPIAMMALVGMDSPMVMEGALGLGAIVLGMLAWGFMGWMTGWLTATFYNRQVS